MPGKPTVSEELPPLDRTQFRLLPIADALMMLMLSRPGGGSLRTTRVTLATIWLSAGVSLVVGIPGLLLIGYAIFSLEWLVLIPGLPAASLGLGSASLAVFGIRQRQLLAARGRQQGEPSGRRGSLSRPSTRTPVR